MARTARACGLALMVLVLSACGGMTKSDDHAACKEIYRLGSIGGGDHLRQVQAQVDRIGDDQIRRAAQRYADNPGVAEARALVRACGD